MNYPIQFGKYLLLERVAVGGMAEVFKAKAFGVEGFERILAIKRILPNMADDDEFINMFVDEARIAVQFSHANIVQIYELGKYENQYYIAMEYVSGKDLRQILDHFRKKKEILPPPVAAFYVSKICDGLDYAHRKSDPTGKALNLIHRDVSPQNILVSYEGAVKITDFGIAKAEDRASKTQAGVLKGKFGYMSPEQVRGLEIDHRSDIFAVGILMYEMLTNKRLFLGDSDFSTLEKVRNAEVPPPTQHNPNISPELERVMLKALARERDERYQWCSELQDDLQQFLIEENTIFNAKRLSAFLEKEYSDDIKAEMQKMEEFMRMPPPSSAEAQAAIAEMRSAPVRTDPGEVHQAEKTMIFESGFADGSSAPTRAGELEPATGEHEAIDVRPSGRGGKPPSRARISYVGPPQPAGGKHLGPILIAGAAFVSLLILLIVVLTTGSNNGTLIVHSSPVPAEVLLDGEVIGTTPLTRDDVPTGRHILVVRAPGFAQAPFSFDLAAESPAVIEVPLQRIEGPRPSADGVIEVASEPMGASVRIGGLPQGTTPLTIRGQDPTRPVILELALTGYQTETKTVTFPAGSNRVTLTVPLKPGAPSDGRGRISVSSTPTEATVYLGSRKAGTTPTEITDLDTSRPYELEITKDGFRPHKETVRFAEGKPLITVNAKLDTFDRKPRKEKDKEKERPREKGHDKEKPRAGGGGTCEGSDGKIAFSAVGATGCSIKVGTTDLGPSPFFAKAGPSGKCEVQVTCSDGKKFNGTRTIRPGALEKIVIKPGDWQ